MRSLRDARRSIRAACGSTVLIALVSACASDTSSPKVGLPDIDAAASAKFDSAVAAFRFYSGIQTSRRVIIDNVGDWLSTWDELTSPLSVRPNPPDIDFNRYMVVLVASGAKPTGGYCIDISAVVGFPNGLFILVTETEPSPDAVVTEAFTQPTDFKLVVRTDASVRFLDDRQSGSCSGN